MKKSIVLWQLAGFAVTSFAGTILHFLYDWTDESLLAAPFSGINESTWEHMKLLFWPMFVYAIAQSFFFRDRKNFWCVKLRGILFGLIMIPVIFYTYNGVVGKSPDWINIAIFFVSAAITYICETIQFKKSCAACASSSLCLAVLCVIGILFIVFTFFTPAIGIFLDPLTGAYGI
jgi:hypothetical protein